MILKICVNSCLVTVKIISEFMKSIVRVLACMFLIAGCRSSNEAKLPSVKEEIDCLSDLIEDVSEETSAKIGLDIRDDLYSLVSESIWETLQSLERIPEPENLRKYFAGLEDMVAVQDWNYDTYSQTADEDRKEIIKDFYKAIDMLQNYADGSLEEYPAREIITELDSIFSAEWMLYSEGGYDDFWALMAYRLLQQAVRYCPDISLISDFVSTDGGVGIYDNTLRTETYQPCYNPVFLRDEDGSWRVYIEEDFLPNKGYKVNFDGTGFRYLVSKHGDTVGSRGYDTFAVRFFGQEGMDMWNQEIWYSDRFDDFCEWIPGYVQSCVLFDPAHLTWTACEKKGEYFYQLPGSPKLRVVFDEDTLCYELTY